MHGAAGSVGLFAVQLAHLHGAHVIATASSPNLKLVAELGADEVIDYRASRFEDGRRRSTWSSTELAARPSTDPGACSNPRQDGHHCSKADQRSKDAFFIVEPNQKQLIEVAKLLDAGTLKTFVSAVVPLEEASDAYSGSVPRSVDTEK